MDQAHRLDRRGEGRRGEYGRGREDKQEGGMIEYIKWRETEERMGKGTGREERRACKKGGYEWREDRGKGKDRTGEEYRKQ